MSTQSDLASRLGGSLGSPDAARRMRDMTGSIRANNESIREGTDNAAELADALNEAADAAEDTGGGFDLMGSAFSGMSSIFSGGMSILKNVGGAIISIGASLAKAAFAIFTFPFKLFSGLIDLAQQGGGGRPLAEAYEEVREIFGDLGSGPGKAVADNFKKVRKETGGLAKTGLSVRKVFGYGIEGIAALLKDINELSAATGDNFSRLAGHFDKMGSKAIVFQRGLGMSKEEFGELAGIAESRGKDIEKYMTNFSKTAVRTAKAFGLGVKDVAKGMKELNLDVENFGHLGPKAFAPITVYARKLGLEIKDMAGVMGKFAGFADTTEAASKMSQAFGMNVDAMELMSAQNPAAKIDILRKAFYKTGKDVTKMTYQQRQYLASLTNLEGKSLEAAFSLEKQGVSYANIAKTSEKANKKQMTQKKVLKELAKGIKRLIQTMSAPKVTGFFDAFVQGFETGIMRSKEFRKVMRNIRSGLRQMRQLGIRVGKAFVKYFPGIKDMLEGIAEFLKPSKFRRFIKVIEPLFKSLFQTQDFKKFANDAIGELQKEFGPGAAGLSKVLDGFMAFAKGAAKLIGEALKWLFELIGEKILPAVRDFFKKVNEDVASGESKTHLESFLSNIDKILRTSAFGQVLIDIFRPIYQAFTGPEFSKMIDGFKELWDTAAPTFSNIGKDLGKWIADGIIDAIKEYGWEMLGGAVLFGMVSNPVMFFQGLAKLGPMLTSAWTAVSGFLTSAGAGGAVLGGLTTAAGGLLKAFLPLHIAFSAIMGLFDAFSAKSGEGITTFFASFAETLTFGIVDADSAMDDFHGTSRRWEKAQKESAESVREVHKEVTAQMDQFMTDTSGRTEKFVAGMEGAVKKIKGSILDVEEHGTAAQKAATANANRALEAMKTNSDTTEAIKKKDIARAKANWEVVARMRKNAITAEEGMGTADFMVNLEGASQDFKVELYTAMKASGEDFEIRGDMAEFEDALIEGDNLRVFHQFIEKYEKRGKGAVATADKALAAREKAIKEKFISIDKDALLSTIKMLKAKGSDTSALEKALKKKLQFQAEGSAEVAALSSDLRAEKVNRIVNEQFAAHMETVVNKEEQQRKKLDSLDAQKQMLHKIEDLKDIPKRLAEAKKSLGAITVEDAKADAEAIVKASMALIEGIGLAFGGMTISQVSAKSKASLDRLKASSEFLTPVTETFTAITKAAKSLKSLVKDGEKLFGSISTKKFQVKLKATAQEMMKVPGIVVAAFSGITGDPVPQWAIDQGYVEYEGAGGYMGDGYQARTPEEIYESAKNNISDGLSEIANFLEPLTTDLDKVAKAMKSLVSHSKKFPNLNEAMATKLAEKVAAGFSSVAIIIAKLGEPGASVLEASTTESRLGRVKRNLNATNQTILMLKIVMKSVKKIKKTQTQQMVNISEDIKTFASNMSAANALLEDKEFKEAIVIFDSLAKTGGGKVTVQHNLPATQVKLNVYISARHFGNAVSKVDLIAGKGKKYIQTAQEKTNK